MTQTVQWLQQESLEFPSHHSALSEPNGLLAIGGDLSLKRLIKAYSLGIFPWYNETQPILWWCPTPRAIIPTDQFIINKSTRKFLKKTAFSVSINCEFEQVINNCAAAPFRKEGTWISKEMKQAYINLHNAGYAQSIEIWSDNTLVGGLYGIAINGYFSGESMFYIKDNASKLALFSLNQLLKSNGIKFIDCQIENPFLNSMGCIEIPRTTFISMKDNAISSEVHKHLWQPRHLNIDELGYNI
ncbi:leucyl/phenylalanyl-tRNA--protein transferase [Thalassotalea profundi]|uniref:Leucyl/phenylalanyl-tRNA--protein transferase n=1 Tax=Thalassotalea profundi TaxID=2036687 RepID=A0ABQ3IJL5_9GAMM|nr:leucyl/phenylalanyl-tRNA--protein transferase [Thalassotalea profundi]GHE82575.1 leucyl/phenylalanyl-tRNA--protein transferase [Thalassotalea profundi]